MVWMVMAFYFAIGFLCSSIFSTAIHRALRARIPKKWEDDLSPEEYAIGQRELARLQADTQDIILRSEAEFRNWKLYVHLFIVVFWLPLIVHFIFSYKRGKA
ncbi:MAG TPA: hypothetical protein VF260_12775 [Bacilli bacterium]